MNDSDGDGDGARLATALMIRVQGVDNVDNVDNIRLWLGSGCELDCWSSDRCLR